MSHAAATSSFTPREVVGHPSDARTAFLKRRYLEAPLYVDIEYIQLLTDSHRRTDGLETLERRAEDHAYALEHLTAVIHPHDDIVGNKTRFVRGAVPYANYAAGPFLKEMRREEQDAQQKHVDQAHGGGIAHGLDRARQSGERIFSGKFLIGERDLRAFEDICRYWEDKCLMAQGDRLWRTQFAEAGFIDDGWAIGLYTAPHDPCPEGRLVLDYDMALTRGYRAIIADLDDTLRSFQPGAVEDGRKVHFWRAARRVLQAALVFAGHYAAEARRLAAVEVDETRQSRLLEIADTCDRVPAEPPRNFREAVQSFWFTYLLGHLEGAHLGYSP
ncbi:MAG: hypothetical protein NTY02_11415, partial [Acidobacteria bacterium]|nr:hypothetical protein [Acidobacteriota bacterium]